MTEEHWRLWQCCRCRRQMRLCSACDRRQRYCSERCAAENRKAGQRLASATYQKTQPGARNHARRMCRYRERQRQRKTMSKVTQQYETQDYDGWETSVEKE